MGVVKHFNHGQTVPNKPKIFVFDIPKHKKVFLRYFDEFDDNYGLICLFPRPKVFVKFVHINKKLRGCCQFLRKFIKDDSRL